MAVSQRSFSPSPRDATNRRSWLGGFLASDNDEITKSPARRYGLAVLGIEFIAFWSAS